MYRYEIVRICALWDGIDLQKKNLPTVVALIDHRAVIDHLREETRQKWNYDAVFANSQSEKAEDAISQSISKTKHIVDGDLYAAIAQIRDQHLAHALITTRREVKYKKRGLKLRMLPGQETLLLRHTTEITEKLFCWVNGKSFNFDDSRKIAKKNAEAFWNSLSFRILNRSRQRSERQRKILPSSSASRYRAACIESSASELRWSRKAGCCAG
jgi:hypothetical protein